MKQYYQLTAKGRAFIAAIDAGLLKQNEEGCVSDEETTKFEIFWNRIVGDGEVKCKDKSFSLVKEKKMSCPTQKKLNKHQLVLKESAGEKADERYTYIHDQPDPEPARLFSGGFLLKLALKCVFFIFLGIALSYLTKLLC